MDQGRNHRNRLDLLLERTALGVAVAILAVFGAQLIGGAEGSAAAVPSAGGMKPKSGLYKGKTAQGAGVSFRVRMGRVSRPRFIVLHHGCLLKVTFPMARRISGNGKFFLGQRSSDFFGGKFTTKRKVRGRAGVDLSHSTCPGHGVHEVRFRARWMRSLR